MIEPRRGALEQLDGRLAGHARDHERERHRLDALAASLRALNPEAVLERGYAIVRQGNAVVTRALPVNADAPMRVRLADGELTAISRRSTPKDEENEEEDHL